MSSTQLRTRWPRRSPPPAVTVKLARKVIAHLSRPQIRTSMEDELIYQTFLNKSEDFAEFRRPSRGTRTEPPGVVMPEFPGLPAPPPVGTSALSAGTSRARAYLVTGGGTGLGKAIASEFARLGADIVIASRKPEHLEAGEQAITDLGARVTTVECDIRDPESITTAFAAAEAAFGMPSVLVNNAAANFPVPAEDMSPNAAHRRRHHPQRHLLRRPRIRATTPRRRDARLDHQCRGVARLDRWSWFRPQRRSKGRRQEHGRDPRRRVGPVRHPGQRTRPRPDAPRGHDRRHPGQPRPHPRQGCDPTRIAGRPAPGTRLGGDIPRAPFARFISGHTLVVDGANWQRRSLTNPEVVTVRDQMGRGPFEP